MVLRESDMTGSNAKRKSPGRMWPDWYPVLATFRNSDTRKATWQLINTIVPYSGLWYLMIRSTQLGYSYALTLILALPAAAFMVRLFILQIASCAAVVFRQHWLSPCAPFEPQNPQLLSEEVLRCCSDAASQAAAHILEKSLLYSVENLGCEAAENGRFSLKWSVLPEK